MRTTTIHTAKVSRPFGKLAVAAILLLGATAAGAITVKAKVGHSVDQITWQNSGNMPKLVGFEEAVY